DLGIVRAVRLGARHRQRGRHGAQPVELGLTEAHGHEYVRHERRFYASGTISPGIWKRSSSPAWRSATRTITCGITRAAAICSTSCLPTPAAATTSGAP